jgi:3-deoxy-D-manno-octulosonate 8-phosphate phosphatase KdsC-like HAD superfamily phosphatase
MKNALILDMDGVLTDGTKIYGNDGYAFAKRYCDHDFTAIKCFQRDGWFVILMSADVVVNRALASNRNIEFWHSRSHDGTIDKVAQLEAMLTAHKLKEDLDNGGVNLVYVGDDLFDIPAMEYVLRRGGSAYCPASAALPVRRYLTEDKVDSLVLTTRGGEGAIMELYTLYSTNTTPPSH